MQKQAPSLGRLLVMVGFTLSCFGLMLFLWLAFGGPVPLKPKGYRVTLSFSEGTQLAKEADVRISGVSVGKVKDIAPAGNGRSRATIELEPRYAPLRSDARAILREKTLLGETYVSITPGSRSARPVPDGGALPVGQVSATVQLDEILRSLPPDRRRDFQVWMQAAAQGLKGRGRDISDTIGNLAPFAEDTTNLLRILNSQQDAVSLLVRNTGQVFAALSERDGQLRRLIEGSNTVFRTTAERDKALEAAFVALPTFEDESRRTLERLAAFSRTTNPLVTQLRPAARQLSPTLQDLNRLSPDLRGLFRDLGPLIDASKKGLPATDRFLDGLRPLLGQLDPFLRELNPILSFAGRYPRELTAFLSNVVAATQATAPPLGGRGAPIHYLRTMNPVNPENLASYPNRLPTNRANPYQMPGAFSQLKDGLPVFDARSCGTAGIPVLGPALADVLPAALRDLVSKFVLAGSAPVAPPCRQQGPFTVDGHTSQFPQVRARPPAR